MKNKDEIKDLFSDKLENFEAKVNPELWGKVAAQIGGGVVATSTGLSVVSKWLIGLGVSGASIVSIVILTSPEDKLLASTPTKPDTVIIKEQQKKEEVSKINEESDFVVQKTPLPEGAIERVERDTTITVEVFETEEEGVGTEEEVVLSEESKEEVSTQTEEETITISEEESSGEESSSEEAAEEEEELQETEASLILPNFFSPNNDGDNDEFFINSEGLNNFNIVILNDKNQTIFQSNNPNFIWRGLNLIGDPVAEGNYLYYLTAEDSKGNPINKYSLLRINK